MVAPKQTDPQFKLRFTPALRDEIEAAAKANNRSMNAEIVARLEETFDGNQSLWDSVNRIEETVAEMQDVLTRVASRVDALWSRPFDGDG